MRVNLESLLGKLSSDPERVRFAREQRELHDASEARDTLALADHAASLKSEHLMSGSSLDKAGVFFRKAPTMPKTEAGYEDESDDAERCGGCVMFAAPRSCTLVLGEIAPGGWCEHWEARK